MRCILGISTIYRYDTDYMRPRSLEPTIELSSASEGERICWSLGDLNATNASSTDLTVSYDETIGR